MKVHSLAWQVCLGGVYHQFYPGKTDFSLYLSLVSVCLYICTGISLYILISWPFWMGSHWWHWTVKSWLSALAVSNGGDISWYILISWLFWMGSYWQHWTVKSWLSALAVLNGGGVHRQFYPGKSENLNFFLVLRVHHHRSFRIYYTKDLIINKSLLHHSLENIKNHNMNTHINGSRTTKMWWRKEIIRNINTQYLCEHCGIPLSLSGPLYTSYKHTKCR